MTEYQLVTLNVIYYMPMPHSHILNTFLWQTYDIRPKYPRIEKFLDHWRREIDAVIKEIIITDSDLLPSYRTLNKIYRLH